MSKAYRVLQFFNDDRKVPVVPDEEDQERDEKFYDILKQYIPTLISHHRQIKEVYHKLHAKLGTSPSDDLYYELKHRMPHDEADSLAQYLLKFDK